MNSAAGSFGLSFGLAMAGGIMLAALSFSFTHLTENSTVIPPAQQQQIAAALEDDAEVMSNTQLEQQITGQPPEVEAEVLAINDDARNLSLQVALLVPLLAACSASATPSGCCGCPTSSRRPPRRAWTSADRPRLHHCEGHVQGRWLQGLKGPVPAGQLHGLGEEVIP